MPRPVNPNSQYTVKPHVTHGHVYASTQPWTVSPETGRKVYRYVHWGVVVDGKFLPGARYVHASLEERAKLIFPPDWDISAIESMSGRRGPGRPAHEGEDASRLYGDIWLLEQIADRLGVRQDLMVVFGDNREVVDEILTLAYFPYLTKWNYTRVARWQGVERAPSTRLLTPREITLLTQSIAERHRMDFLRRRLARLGQEELCAVDTTSRSAYGGSLAEPGQSQTQEIHAVPFGNRLRQQGDFLGGERTGGRRALNALPAGDAGVVPLGQIGEWPG